MQLNKRKLLLVAAGLMFASSVAGALAVDTIYHGRIVVGKASDYSTPTCATAASDGELCVTGDIESNGDLDIAGNATLTGNSTLTGTTTHTGDVTFNGGASAITFGASSSSIVVPDNSATALVIGSTGALSTVKVVSSDSSEGVTITGYETVTGTLTSAGLVSTTLEADLTAGACTAGTWKVDNASTRELCRCNDAGSAYDCISVTTANGPTN